MCDRYVILHEFHVTNPSLVKECLVSMAAFINWIDVQLVLNDKFVPGRHSQQFAIYVWCNVLQCVLQCGVCAAV